MVKGIDVSHWQGSVDWKKVKEDGIDFAILKATEALNYVDPTLEKNVKEARDNGVLLGFYHFARGNDAQKEADFFVSKLPKMQEGEFLVLDYEINIVNEVKWCRKFLDRVFDQTGIRPLLYTNEFRVKSLNWQYVVDGNYGLWVAKYGVNNGEMNEEPSIGQWPFLAMWQYTSKGKVDGIDGNVDLDQAYMDLDALKKYGKLSVKEENDEKDDTIESLQTRLEEEKEQRAQAEEREKVLQSQVKNLKEKIKQIRELTN